MSNKKYKNLRIARIIVSVAIFAVMTVTVGLSYHTFLDSWQIVPAIVTGTAEWILLWAAITAFFGRIYCSTACPLGTLQDFLARLKRRRFGYFYAQPFTLVRLGIALIFIVAFIAGIASVISVLDPATRFMKVVTVSSDIIRSAAFTVSSAVSAAITLAVVAAFAISRGRLFCNTICPVGTVLGMASRFSLYQMDINTDKCIGCGRCTARCKAQCIDPSAHTVDVSRCVVCFDCVAGCPNDAITFRKGRHKLQMPLMQDVNTAGASQCNKPG